MPVSANDLQLLCLFQLGTPPQPYVVVENGASEVAIVRAPQDVFDFLRTADIPLCEPETVPPGSLFNLELLCVFRLFIGAQAAVPYVVGRDVTTGAVAIVQINEAVHSFLTQLGVPVCQITDTTMDS